MQSFVARNQTAEQARMRLDAPAAGQQRVMARQSTTSIAGEAGGGHRRVAIAATVQAAPYAAPARQPLPPTAMPRRVLPLSRREQEVLRLVATGSTDREIANVLSVSRHTVGNHVRHILAKFGVSTRAAAVAAAVRARTF